MWYCVALWVLCLFGGCALGALSLVCGGVCGRWLAFYVGVYGTCFLTCTLWLAFYAPSRYLLSSLSSLWYFLRSLAFLSSYSLSVTCFLVLGSLCLFSSCSLFSSASGSLSLLSLCSLWAITFGALGRSRLFVRTLILRVLALSISLGCSFLASSFVSLSLYSDILKLL